MSLPPHAICHQASRTTTITSNPRFDTTHLARKRHHLSSSIFPNLNLFDLIPLKILLPPNIPKPRLGIHVTLGMQLTPQRLRPAKKYSCLSRRMKFTDRFENSVPIGPAKVCRCTQASNGVLVRRTTVDHDVSGVIHHDFSCKVLEGCSAPDEDIYWREEAYSMDLYMTVHILCFNRHKQRPKPFERSKVSANPEEIHLPQPSLLFRVIHTVPDTLEN